RRDAIRVWAYLRTLFGVSLVGSGPFLSRHM
ncbi:MAG: hypothetical protein QOI57_3112, partial [Rubrobacteraceae bacterium]|nr:hypothetical protein [Rubrobacteraceae bacterium]